MWRYTGLEKIVINDGEEDALSLSLSPEACGECLLVIRQEEKGCECVKKDKR